MQFLVSSRLAPGVTREQALEFLKGSDPTQRWELFRTGTINHVLWKVGERPGVAFTISADSEEALREQFKDSASVTSGVFEWDIDRISPFRQFD